MRFDSSAIMDMQRRAFLALSQPTLTENDVRHHRHGMNAEPGPTPAPGTAPVVVTTKEGTVTHTKVAIPNKHYVPAKLTSSPGMLIQELPWINTTQNFTFNFSIDGPQQTPGV